MYQVKVFILVLSLVMCVAAFGFDQTELDSLCRQFELQEIEVLSQESGVTSPLPVQRLKGEQLQALSSHSVADALRFFSGIQIKDFGGIGGMKTVDVRSMGTHHLGVFYDGIEIGNAQNGTVDLGKFSLENIDEIALYNGQKADIFQPAKDFGSAGTLYLRTRRPRFENGRNYHLTATMRAGSFGLANPALLYEHKLSDDIHLSVNGEYVFATGRYRVRGCQYSEIETMRQNGDVQTERAEVGVFGYLPNGKWHIKGYFYNSEKGIPRAIIRNVWTSAQRQWDRNAFVQGNFTNTWTMDKGTRTKEQGQRNKDKGTRTKEQGQRNKDDGQWTKEQGQRNKDKGTRTKDKGRCSLMVNVKYSNDYMRYRNNDSITAFVDNRYWQQEVYVSIANQWALFPWWCVDISADYIWNQLRANLLRFANPERHTGLVAVASGWQHKWFKAQVSCLGTWTMDKGTRTMEQGQRNKDDGQWTKEQGQRTMDKREKPRFTPMVSVSYQPLLREQLYLRGFYKQVFRMPTFNDLYYTEVGQANLQPEETVQYDGGIEYTHTWTMDKGTRTKDKGTRTMEQGQRTMDKGTRTKDDGRCTMHLKLDGYFNQVNNKIVAIPKGNSQYRWMMMNLGYVEIRGVDVNAGLDFTFPLVQSPDKPITLSVNGIYTYQKAQDFTNPNDELTYGGQIAYIPWNSASTTASLAWNGWSLHYAFSYVGTRFIASANTLANLVGAWNTHDLSLSKIWNLPTGRLSTTIEINNLSNTQYEIIRNYPMPGLNGKLIVKYSL